MVDSITSVLLRKDLSIAQQMVSLHAFTIQMAMCAYAAVPRDSSPCKFFPSTEDPASNNAMFPTRLPIALTPAEWDVVLAAEKRSKLQRCASSGATIPPNLLATEPLQRTDSMDNDHFRRFVFLTSKIPSSEDEITEVCVESEPLEKPPRKRVTFSEPSKDRRRARDEEVDDESDDNGSTQGGYSGNPPLILLRKGDSASGLRRWRAVFDFSSMISSFCLGQSRNTSDSKPRSTANIAVNSDKAAEALVDCLQEITHIILPGHLSYFKEILDGVCKLPRCVYRMATRHQQQLEFFNTDWDLRRSASDDDDDALELAEQDMPYYCTRYCTKDEIKDMVNTFLDTMDAAPLAWCLSMPKASASAKAKSKRHE